LRRVNKRKLIIRREIVGEGFLLQEERGFSLLSARWEAKASEKKVRSRVKKEKK